VQVWDGGSVWSQRWRNTNAMVPVGNTRCAGDIQLQSRQKLRPLRRGGYNSDGLHLTVTGCTFSENGAEWGGGIGSGGTVKLSNCTFSKNYASWKAAGVANGEAKGAGWYSAGRTMARGLRIALSWGTRDRWAGSFTPAKTAM